MKTNNTDPNKLGVAKFAALKTAIVNDEEALVKELLTDLSIQEIERSYLIDLAKLKNNLHIIKLFEDISLKNK
jgi:hypothetical protein